MSNCLSTAMLFQTSLLSTKDSGLFCIYTDNYPGRVTFPFSSVATTTTELNRQFILYSRTGDVASNPFSYSLTDSSFYRSGDPLIVLYYSNVTTGYLALPTSLNGDTCHDGNPITFLNNRTSTCSRYLSPDGAECSQYSPLNPLNYYTNISVFDSPGMSNDSLLIIELREVTCSASSGPTSCNITDVSLPVYNTSSLTCHNAVLSVGYIVIHDGSNGIARVLVDISVGQVPVGTFKQTFSVQFVPVLETAGNVSNDSWIGLIRSGNPGYIDGEPVLAGVLLSNDLIGLNVDRRNWLTLLKRGTTGECDKNQRESVTFRDNMKTSCVLRYMLTFTFVY